jgi:hypothetical protein
MRIHGSSLRLFVGVSEFGTVLSSRRPKWASYFLYLVFVRVSLIKRAILFYMNRQSSRQVSQKKVTSMLSFKSIAFPLGNSIKLDDSFVIDASPPCTRFLVISSSINRT